MLYSRSYSLSALSINKASIQPAIDHPEIINTEMSAFVASVKRVGDYRDSLDMNLCRIILAASRNSQRELSTKQGKTECCAVNIFVDSPPNAPVKFSNIIAEPLRDEISDDLKNTDERFVVENWIVHMSHKQWSKLKMAAEPNV